MASSGYSREYHQPETEQKQDGLHDRHTFLKDDFVGKDVEPGTDSQNLTAGFVTLAFEGNDG